ncbi:hypothetical protein J2S55_008723 [Streptosporangium brasiliense]|uniref:Uncharacterized protein n=1 Tax=Streptosporangium brasiliense TaxID=47480 RepID=A0ABT9RJI9_9ACTN|nr:hypothetical protein [Streptosporangium brasiliense]
MWVFERGVLRVRIVTLSEVPWWVLPPPLLRR